MNTLFFAHNTPVGGGNVIVTFDPGDFDDELTTAGHLHVTVEHTSSQLDWTRICDIEELQKYQ